MIEENPEVIAKRVAEMQQMTARGSTAFCGICRHPSPGHELGCPVATGEPVPGVLSMQDPKSPSSIQSPTGLAPAGQSLGNVPSSIYPQGPVGPGCSNPEIGYAPLTGDPPFKSELTVIWAQEKAEIMRRLSKLEHHAVHQDTEISDHKGRLEALEAYEVDVDILSRLDALEFDVKALSDKLQAILEAFATKAAKVT